MAWCATTTHALALALDLDDHRLQALYDVHVGLAAGVPGHVIKQDNKSNIIKYRAHEASVGITRSPEHSRIRAFMMAGVQGHVQQKAEAAIAQGTPLIWTLPWLNCGPCKSSGFCWLQKGFMQVRALCARL